MNLKINEITRIAIKNKLKNNKINLFESRNSEKNKYFRYFRYADSNFQTESPIILSKIQRFNILVANKKVLIVKNKSGEFCKIADYVYLKHEFIILNDIGGRVAILNKYKFLKKIFNFNQKSKYLKELDILKELLEKIIILKTDKEIDELHELYFFTATNL